MQTVPQNTYVSKYGLSKGQVVWQLPDAATLHAMWHAHMLAQECQHYTAPDDAHTLLGHRDTADAQRQVDGDLVALACGRRP